MTPAALPLARTRQPLNVPRFCNSRFCNPRSAPLCRALEFLGIATLLVSLICLTACSGVSSGASQTSSPQISGTLAAANVGVPYTGTLSATGGKPPYAFTVPSGTLPTGLTLSQTAGTITGTPTQTGTFTFTAQVTDSTGSNSSQEFQAHGNDAGCRRYCGDGQPRQCHHYFAGNDAVLRTLDQHEQRRGHLVRVTRKHFQQRSLSVARGYDEYHRHDLCYERRGSRLNPERPP